MLLGSLRGMVSRLRRGKAVRDHFVESHLNKTIAYQIRATRDLLGWSQEQLAVEVGMNQNAISRLESPDYGKPTLTTLKRLASAFDVALVVRFVPFSELMDWTTSTPRIVKGLGVEALAVANFHAEEKSGVFEKSAHLAGHHLKIVTAAGSAKVMPNIGGVTEIFQSQLSHATGARMALPATTGVGNVTRKPPASVLYSSHCVVSKTITAGALNA
jgi:transcriptional regulator with XRE-family HTH domain